MNYKNASGYGEPCLGSDQDELKRALITQFYDDSVLRYGPDSEQARALLKFLGSEPVLTNGRFSGDANCQFEWTAGRSAPAPIGG